ncbi:MAG: hypothetical protein K2N77_03640 [Lachnospiraceae bacterium]|nr:hypothetical protein [Lachnospiraceae bacterium]
MVLLHMRRFAILFGEPYAAKFQSKGVHVYGGKAGGHGSLLFDRTAFFCYNQAVEKGCKN